MGHSGTLDPMAVGVLPIFLNKATKAIKYLKNTDKEYLAEFMLGIKTDTKDITGKILEKEKSFVEKEQLIECLNFFKGEIFQMPPMYSAVKVNGVSLYKLARKGITVKRKKRAVKIYNLSCVEFSQQKQTGVLKISCSSGTYVRSLIEDLAKKLKTIGVLTNLKRTKACGFCLKNSLTLNEVETKKEQINYLITPIEEIFSNLNSLKLSLNEQKAFLNGAKLQFKTNEEKGSFFKVYGTDFLGLGVLKDGFLKVEKNFFG